MSRAPDFRNVIARKKLGVPTEWEWFKWEAVGHDEQSGAYLLTGGIPRLLKSGPRKGKKTWRDCKTDRVVVTMAEIRQAEAEYEAETGNCSKCGGSQQEFAGWSRDEGTKYRPCRRCNATGKAPGGAA